MLRTSSDAALARLDLPGDVSGVSQARALVRRTLQDWDLEHLLDTTTLLVSELATNAVLHARTGFAVVVEHRPPSLLVTVHDGAATSAVRRRHGLQAATGRGLALVETLAVRWGTSRSEVGYAKAVWFELPLDPAQQRDSDEGALYGEDWLALVDDL